LCLYHVRLDKRMSPRCRPYNCIGGNTPTAIPEHATDIGALSNGSVSLTSLPLEFTACNDMNWIKK
jgi:broad specificity polyphosphatase/5'/3'-nucleotidase SurE